MSKILDTLGFTGYKDKDIAEYFGVYYGLLCNKNKLPNGDDFRAVDHIGIAMGEGTRIEYSKYGVMKVFTANTITIKHKDIKYKISFDDKENIEDIEVESNLNEERGIRMSKLDEILLKKLVENGAIRSTKCENIDLIDEEQIEKVISCAMRNTGLTREQVEKDCVKNKWFNAVLIYNHVYYLRFWNKGSGSHEIMYGGNYSVQLHRVSERKGYLCCKHCDETS